jgi:hypothetical protein
MTELDDQARELLSQARRALSPTAEDQARVLRATQRAALVQPPPASAAPLAAKLVVALSIAGISGTIGFVLGRHSGHHEDAHETHVAKVAPAAPEPVAAEPAPTAVEKVVAVHAEPPRIAGERTRPRVAPAPKPAPTEVSVDPFAEMRNGASSSLEIEVRFMKAVERALRDNEPGLALRVLDQLDEEVPRGVLDEERLAASVMARCKLGLGKRAELIEELTTRYPTSAYGPRVRNSCRKPP